MLDIKKDLIPEENMGGAGYEDIDLVVAAEEVAQAEIGLFKEETKLGLMTQAYESLETISDKLNEAVSKGYEEANVPAGLGAEDIAILSTGMTLGIEESDINVLTSGFEEKTDGFLKKLWEGIKAAIKKVWDFIVNLAGKIKDFVLGLFGKGQTTSEKLKGIVKSLEEGKKTKLDGKFDDKVKESIASTNGGVIVVKNKVDAKSIEEVLKLDEDVLKANKESVKIGKKFISDMKDQIKDIEKLTIDDIGRLFGKFRSDLEKIEIKVNVDSPELKTGYNYATVGISSKGVQMIGIHVETDKEDDGDTSYTTKFHSILLGPKEKNITEVSKSIKPLSINDIEDLSKKYEGLEKRLSKELSDDESKTKELLKINEDIVKVFDKAIEKAEKKDKKDLSLDALKDLAKAYKEITGTFLNKTTTATLSTIKDIAASNGVVKYAQESAKLYVAA